MARFWAHEGAGFPADDHWFGTIGPAQPGRNQGKGGLPGLLPEAPLQKTPSFPACQVGRWAKLANRGGSAEGSRDWRTARDQAIPLHDAPAAMLRPESGCTVFQVAVATKRTSARPSRRSTRRWSTWRWAGHPVRAGLRQGVRQGPNALVRHRPGPDRTGQEERHGLAAGDSLSSSWAKGDR